MRLRRLKSVEEEGEGLGEGEEAGKGKEEVGEEARMPRSQRFTRQKVRREVRRINQPVTTDRVSTAQSGFHLP